MSQTFQRKLCLHAILWGWPTHNFHGKKGPWIFWGLNGSPKGFCNNCSSSVFTSGPHYKFLWSRGLQPEVGWRAWATNQKSTPTPNTGDYVLPVWVLSAPSSHWAPLPPHFWKTWLCPWLEPCDPNRCGIKVRDVNLQGGQDTFA